MSKHQEKKKSKLDDKLRRYEESDSLKAFKEVQERIVHFRPRPKRVSNVRPPEVWESVRSADYTLEK